jgi:hypothetical protein
LGIHEKRSELDCVVDEDRRAHAKAKSLMEFVDERRGWRNALTEMLELLGGVYGVVARESEIEFDNL